MLREMSLDEQNEIPICATTCIPMIETALHRKSKKTLLYWNFKQLSNTICTLNIVIPNTDVADVREHFTLKKKSPM